MITRILNTPEETNEFAARLAPLIKAPCVLCLKGDLGTGKTAFARAFIQAKSKADLEVPSPTFTLIQTYETPQGLLSHLDLYRLTSPTDALEIGIEEIFSEGITLIEWPERLGSLLPPQRIEISFKVLSPTAREITIEFINLPILTLSKEDRL